jgi:hypothetical protein
MSRLRARRIEQKALPLREGPAWILFRDVRGKVAMAGLFFSSVGSRIEHSSPFFRLVG